ncbi:hypothetical protein CLI83_10700, partial [Porphyromonas gingivalis]
MLGPIRQPRLTVRPGRLPGMIAGVAAKRMNREQFFRAASGLDEDRLRKALW